MMTAGISIVVHRSMLLLRSSHQARNSRTLAHSGYLLKGEERIIIIVLGIATGHCSSLSAASVS